MHVVCECLCVYEYVFVFGYLDVSVVVYVFDYYDDERSYLESRVLHGGDVVLLAAGGHGFEMLEDSEIIEVKQGPYAGEMDKVRFDPVSLEHVRFPAEKDERIETNI